MPTDLTLEVPSIKLLDGQAAPFAIALANLVASVAKMDDMLTPSEYRAALSVADNVAGLSTDPAILSSMILRALTLKKTHIDEALKQVAATQAGIDPLARRPLLEALLPLLAEQVEGARPLARRVGTALHVPFAEQVIEAAGLPLEDTRTASVKRWVSGVIGRTSALAGALNEVAHYTNDAELLASISASKDEAAMRGVLKAALDRLHASLELLVKANSKHERMQSIACDLERQADELNCEVVLRLALLEKRAELLKRHAKQEIEDFAEAIGDSAEVDLRRLSETRGLLLRSDDSDVRERMIAKTAAFNFERLKRRYDEHLTLLREELAQHGEEHTKAANASIAPISLAEWRLTIPGPTGGARVKDVLDSTAGTALVGGVVAAAGTIGAVGAGLLAPAAALAVAATPVGAFVVIGAAVAGVWKLSANPGERLRTEQRKRADATRKVTHEKVALAFAEIEAAIDAVVLDFRTESAGRIMPLRHTAERLREMCDLQRNLCQQICLDARSRIERWQRSI